MMLYYCPLESYEERYTMQWAAAKTGWLERNWIKHHIPYIRIDSIENSTTIHSPIASGAVLDTLRRNRHCCDQVNQLMSLASIGVLTGEDVIYFDDFWHFNIQALAYHFHQIDIAPKMFAFCHAQSVDEFDFTHPMRHWMRDFEKGIGNILTGIFVNSSLLKELLVLAEIGTEKSVHVIGHIFCEEEVRERYPKELPPKEDTVIFSSRWDDEKNPLLFLSVVNYIMESRNTIKFVICTSAKELKSNNPINLLRLDQAMNQYPNNLFLKEGLSKEEYYLELLKAKVQINTAQQDWVSIALLEASVAGCYPVYPNIRSFPQAFRQSQLDTFMYAYPDAMAAAYKIYRVMKNPQFFTKESIRYRDWIHRRHNVSWARMINIMMDDKVIEVEKYL